MNKIFQRKVITALIAVMVFSFVMVGLIALIFPDALVWNPKSWDGRSRIGIFYDGNDENRSSSEKGRRTFEQERIIEAEEKIVIESDVSEIRILPQEEDKLTVRYQAYENSTFEVDSDGKQIRVIAMVDGRHRRPKNVGLLIYCPKSYCKDLEIKTNIGAIELAGDYRSVDIETNIGSADISGSADFLRFESNLGELTAAGVFESADLSSNIGAIDFQTDQMKDGEYKIETSMGDIRVELPKDADVSIEAYTEEMGSLSCEARLDEIHQSSGTGEKKLSAKKNAGVAKLHLSASAGSILIED